MLEEEQKTVETTETTVTTDNKPQKKSHKKAIIITSVVAAGAVAVGAGVPAILSMKKGAEQQYLKENPTKYLAHSVTNYFNEQEKNNGAYNFAKNIYKTGGIKFNYNAQGTEVSAVAGYDSQNRQVYIDLGNGYETHIPCTVNVKLCFVIFLLLVRHVPEITVLSHLTVIIQRGIPHHHVFFVAHLGHAFRVTHDGT